MQLHSIEIENFLSVGSITYDFRDQGFVLVEGDNRDVSSSRSNGAGKCHARGTLILMVDGTTKAVEDVSIGDLVMGNDSKPRQVITTHLGRSKLYKIQPKKGMPYVVSEGHILVLKLASRHRKGRLANLIGGDGLVRIAVEDYLVLPMWCRNLLVGIRAAVDFSSKDVPLDPYFLGVWLGDGTRGQPHVTTADKEIAEVMYQVACEHGLAVRVASPHQTAPAYCISAGKTGAAKLTMQQVVTIRERYVCGERRSDMAHEFSVSWTTIDRIVKNRCSPVRNEFIGNPVSNNLDELGGFYSKHIPHLYKCNSREVRAQVLAGLLDTDGSLSRGGFDYISKDYKLAEDVCFVARSLGLAAYLKTTSKGCQTGAVGTYYRVSISGDCSTIPTRIPRKQSPSRKINKNCLHVGIREIVQIANDEEYFGFQTDGNHLYLLSDFTVVHNSTAFVDALCWCIFNQTTKGQSADLITPGGDGKGTRVSVDLLIDDKKLRISRYRKHPDGKNASRLEVEDHYDDCALGLGDECDCPGWKDISKSTNPATDKLIQSFIRADKQTFLYTTILGQGLMFRFSQLTDQQRKEVLESISDLGVFELARKKARKEAREISSHLDSLSGQLRELNVSIGDQQDALERSKDAARSEEDRREKKRTDIQEEVNLKAVYVTKLQESLETLPAVGVLEKNVQLMNGVYEKISERVQGERGKIVAAETELSLATTHLKKMNTINGADCPLCGSALTKEHLLGETHRRNQIVADAKDAVLAKKNGFDSLESKETEAKVAYEKVRDTEKSRHKDRVTLEAQIQQTIETVESLRRRLVDLDEESQHTAIIENAVALLAKTKARKVEVLGSIANTQKELNEVEFWVDGFQKIRVRVISKMLDFLNARLAHYCQILSDGELLVRMSNDEKGQINLVVTTRGGSYASASGGEKDRLDIAIAFALHDLASNQRDFQSNVLVLDEIAGFVDDAGIERIMQLVMEKLERVESCFLISQNPVFKGYTDKTWTVVKEDGVSRLETA